MGRTVAFTRGKGGRRRNVGLPLEDSPLYRCCFQSKAGAGEVGGGAGVDRKRDVAVSLENGKLQAGHRTTAAPPRRDSKQHWGSR